MTQKEIASMLNVSIATVSLALKDHPRVNANTKRRILEMVQMTNYKPNQTAINLKRGKTMSIGVILPRFSEPFFAELVDAIHNSLSQKGYLGLFFPSETTEEYITSIEELSKRNVDGIISRSPNPEEQKRAEQENIPIVYYNHLNKSGDTVICDHLVGTSLAINHLLEIGRRRIALIGKVSDEDKRFIGYVRTLAEHGIPFREELVCEGNGLWEYGYRSMKKILPLDNRPDGVFCHSDVSALGALRAISEMGLKVPEDIAVVGYDDIKEAEYATVPLTSVHNNRYRLAEELVSLLFSKFDCPENKESQCIVLKPELIIRASTIGRNWNIPEEENDE